MRKVMAFLLGGMLVLGACDGTDVVPPAQEEIELETLFAPAGQPGNMVRVILQVRNMREQALIAAQARAQGVQVLYQYDMFPLLALRVNENALRGLSRSPRILAVVEDIPQPPALTSATAVVDVGTAHGLGFDGAGWTVAILDTAGLRIRSEKSSISIVSSAELKFRSTPT